MSLDASDAAAIRVLASQGRRMYELAEMYNVELDVVRQILLGKLYPAAGGPLPAGRGGMDPEAHADPACAAFCKEMLELLGQV